MPVEAVAVAGAAVAPSGEERFASVAAVELASSSLVVPSSVAALAVESAAEKSAELAGVGRGDGAAGGGVHHRLQRVHAVEHRLDAHAATLPRRCMPRASSSSWFCAAARPFGVVLGLLAVLELLDRLAVARGGREVHAARVDLGVLAVQVQRGLAAHRARTSRGAPGRPSGSRRPCGRRSRSHDRPAASWLTACVASRRIDSARMRSRSSLASSSLARSSARSRIVLTRSSRNVKDGVSTSNYIDPLENSCSPRPPRD